MVVIVIVSIVLGIKITAMYNPAIGIITLIVACVIIGILMYYGYDDPRKRFPWQR
jgi:uncharacterized membrane-anchored protein